ncbi:MAG: NADH-quinone oxidoreductase subunit A [Phycisphaerae bacterium]|jgi:NADH-quinone oxidoreductase subunit A
MDPKEGEDDMGGNDVPILMAAEGGVQLVQGMTLFVIAGFLMIFGALFAGRFVRPQLPHADKSAAYECGEPAFGTSWVQFDLRFYVVALVFLIFDVEVALFYPWAVVYGGGAHRGSGAGAEVLQQVKVAALFDMLFFFGVIVVGFLYLWRFGYLDWVRASTGNRAGHVVAPPPKPREPAAA